eukprot:2930265-Rhodomonas_salina.1
MIVHSGCYLHQQTLRVRVAEGHGPERGNGALAGNAWASGGNKARKTRTRDRRERTRGTPRKKQWERGGSDQISRGKGGGEAGE